MQTVKKPLLTVIGFIFASNEMLVGCGYVFDDCTMTRNSSLYRVQTNSGYSAEKNWNWNENDCALVGALSCSTSSV